MNSYKQGSDAVRTFFIQVFGWMSIGLGLTATLSWYIFNQNHALLDYLVESPTLFLALFFVQIALVFFISSTISTLSFSTALSIFLLYASLNGIIFSRIFFVYTQESIALTFGVAAITFFIMALFGAYSSFDLTSIGVFGYMVLCGLIVSMVLNWYFQSELIDIVISGIGVILFSALTAYDMQQLTVLSKELDTARDYEVYKIALMGALKLYLDFINLFLMVLSFTGKRRD